MSVINVNSISGINSITAQSTSVTFYNTTGGLGEIIADFDQTVASRSEIVGISTVGITTINNSTITLIGSGQAANISNGFSVVGAGITPGTTVASGGGTVNIVLSQTAGFSTATNALTFYTNSKPVSPGGIGGMLCRAWVNFNGAVPAVGMIRAANNIRSIDDGGTGTYTLNFTTAMPDVNYAIAGFSIGISAATTGLVSARDTFSPATGSCQILSTRTDTMGVADLTHVHVAFFR